MSKSKTIDNFTKLYLTYFALNDIKNNFLLS